MGKGHPQRRFLSGLYLQVEGLAVVVEADPRIVQGVGSLVCEVSAVQALDNAEILKSNIRKMSQI